TLMLPSSSARRPSSVCPPSVDATSNWPVTRERACTTSTFDKASPRSTTAPILARSSPLECGRTNAITRRCRARSRRANSRPTPRLAPNITKGRISGISDLVGEAPFELVEALNLIGLQTALLIATHVDLEDGLAVGVEELDR